MSQQPDWRYVTNLGDASPIEHGGDFLYVDATGVYDPELEHLLPPEDHLFDTPRARWEISRFSILPCTFKEGILSDNRFHPECPAWFAQPESRRKERPQDTTYLRNISDACGMDEEDLIEMFLSKDVRARAAAWLMVGNHHGFENLDQYPIRVDAPTIDKQYVEELKLESARTCRGEHKTFRRVWAFHPRGGRVYGYASDPRPGVYSLERYIATSVEKAACGGGMSFPEMQVNLAAEDDPHDPDNAPVAPTP